MAEQRDDDERDRNPSLPATEPYEANETVTGEVGSEGGSPGETVRTRERVERPRGSEATETLAPDARRVDTVERVDEDGRPVRRTP